MICWHVIFLDDEGEKNYFGLFSKDGVAYAQSTGDRFKNRCSFKKCSVRHSFEQDLTLT